MSPKSSNPCSSRAKEHYKYIDLPLSNYTSASYDKLSNHGKRWAYRCSRIQLQRAFDAVVGRCGSDIEIGNEVTDLG